MASGAGVPAGGIKNTTAEIAQAVWDRDRTSHQSAGTFGIKIDDTNDTTISTGAGGGLSLTFDNARISMTANQTDETIPATGESDFVTVVNNIPIGSGNFFVSADSGTNYKQIEETIGVMTPESFFKVDATVLSVSGIGNSTGRYKITSDAVAGTRIFSQDTTTFS